jgi:hypothetical protein
VEVAAVALAKVKVVAAAAETTVCQPSHALTPDPAR